MFYTLLLTIFYGAILSESGDCQNGGQQVLILRLKDVTKGVCSSGITSTGLENPDNPEANCYSIVGKLNKDEFKNPDGTYELYLTYGGTQGGHNPQDPIQLRWVQSTWITEKFNSGGGLQNAPGFRVINFNPPDVSSGDDKFYGLGKSDTTHCYLDGTSGGGDWFNCVGVVTKWSSPGIASYNRGSSKSEALYACRADPCAGVTCPDEEMCVEGKCQRDCGWLDIDGFLNDCSAEFKGQNGKLGTINTKLVDLEQQIKANDGDIQTNKDGINTNAGGISTNGQAIAQLRTDVTGNDQDIAKLRTDVDSNDGDITDLQSKLSAQQTKIDDQQTKIDAQQTKIDAQQVKIDAQQIKIGEQDTKIAKLEAAVQKNEKKLRRKSGSAAMMDFDGDLDDEYHRKYYDDNMNKPYYGWSWESMSWQDIAIIVVIILLMLNLIIMAYRNCCGKKQKKKPYRRVRYMDSEDVDSEANLK